MDSTPSLTGYRCNWQDTAVQIQQSHCEYHTRYDPTDVANSPHSLPFAVDFEIDPNVFAERSFALLLIEGCAAVRHLYCSRGRWTVIFMIESGDEGQRGQNIMLGGCNRSDEDERTKRTCDTLESPIATKRWLPGAHCQLFYKRHVSGSHYMY